MGRVFNSKLGRIAALLSKGLARMQEPLLELKLGPGLVLSAKVVREGGILIFGLLNKNSCLAAA